MNLERVLLIGGPFHFRTVMVKPSDYDVLIPLPSELPPAVVSHELYAPQSLDFKVARYARSSEFVKAGSHMGWLFEYAGER